MASPKTGYEIVRNGAGFLALSQSVLRFQGSDLVEFLQGSLTNDVKTLNPEKGLKACHLDVKGRLLATLTLFQGRQGIWAFTSARETDSLKQGIKNTLFLSQSELEDLSGQFVWIFFIGARAGDLISKVFGLKTELGPLAHRSTTTFGFEGELLRDPDWEYPAYLWLVPRSKQDPAFAALKKEPFDFPVDELSPEVYEILRVESGIAAFGVDTNEKTLPPEANLDEGYISYTKGCYVGQEVIARIKHLGHVNKRLAKLKLDVSEPLSPGLPVLSDEKEVGTLTSSVYSPRWNSVLGLSIMRLEASESGKKVKVKAGDREISGVVI